MSLNVAVRHTAASRTRGIRFVLLAVLVVVASIPLVALWKAFGPHTDFAPDFTLTDQDGRPFTLSSERGHPVALFFGYTHCPDVCPTTLAHLAQAFRDPGVPRDLQTIFVTVDPDRDSPAVLKRYVRIFNPTFIGLTGTLQRLDPVYAAYHMWREDWPAHHSRDSYFVAHGSTIYYIGRNGAITGYGHWDDQLPQLTHDLKGLS